MKTGECIRELSNYIANIKGMMPAVSENTGHTVASMLIGYRSGLYDRAIGRADRLLLKLEGDDERKALRCAVEIIRGHSVELLPSQKSIRSEFDWEGGDPTKTFGYKAPDETKCSFTGDDKKYFAVRQDDTTPSSEYERDNALILAYACAYISSPDDRLPLEEQVLGYIIQRMEFYRNKQP